MSVTTMAAIPVTAEAYTKVQNVHESMRKQERDYITAQQLSNMISFSLLCDTHNALTSICLKKGTHPAAFVR